MPLSHDFGVDIIASRYFSTETKKVAIQCKNLDNTSQITIRAIQEVYAGKAFYDCTDAWIVGNGRLTRNAEIMAKKLGVTLFGGPEFTKYLESTKCFDEEIKVLESPEYQITSLSRDVSVEGHRGNLIRCIEINLSVFEYSHHHRTGGRRMLAVVEKYPVIEQEILDVWNNRDLSRRVFLRNPIFQYRDNLAILKDFSRIEVV